MIYIFPRMTKCTFHKFGTSGEVEKHDALCILPLNIGNVPTCMQYFFLVANSNSSFYSHWSSLLTDDSPEDDAADAGVDEVKGPAGGEEGRDEAKDQEADEDSQQATLRKIIVQNIK